MAIKDITLGQYYPAVSTLHSLDARTKIISTLVYLAALFCVDTFYGFALAAAFLAFCIALSRVPAKLALRSLKPILVLVIFTAIFNIFTGEGEVLLAIGKLHITDGGLLRAAFMSIRLALLILGTTLLTYTTKPVALTDGLERLLSPLSAIGLPAHTIAMTTTIALRFIPTLLGETDKIMKAQTARGADFESGKLLQRAKALIPLLVPLFVSAFRIAGDLAMAMDARCYRGGSGRTRMNEMKLRSRDFATFAAMAVFLALEILL